MNARQHHWSASTPRPSVSMTWPQYRRCECSVDGEVVLLSPTQAEILSALLMRRGEVLSAQDLIEQVYPDPDRGPEWEVATIKGHMHLLRQRVGDAIRTEWARGFSIPLPCEPAVRNAA